MKEIKYDLPEFNSRIIDVLFFLIVFLFMFDEVPKPMQLKMLGGPIADDLVVYPVIVSIVYTGYVVVRDPRVLVAYKPFILYTTLFLGFSLLSLFIGLMNYPSYEEAAAGTAIKSHIFSYLFAVADIFHIPLKREDVIALLLALRSIKNLLLFVVYIWGGSYIIFCWYHQNAIHGFKVCMIGGLASVFIFLIFGFLNMMAIAGNDGIKSFMYQYLYPYSLETSRVFYADGTLNYIPNQIRANLPEASHIGNYAAVILPSLLMIGMLLKKMLLKVAWAILLALFLLLCFLSQSRTALGIMIGIFILFIVLIMFVNWRKWKYIAVVLCISGLAFGGALLFIRSNTQIVGVDVASGTTITKDYLTQNITSLDLNSPSSRGGNAPRKTYIMIHVKEGLDHPLLGVGPGLSTGYDLNYVTNEDLKNPEVQRAVHSLESEGPVDSTYSLYAQNEFAQRFAENGLIGIFLFVVPFVFIEWKLLLLLKRGRGETEKGVFISWAIITVAATFVSSANGSATMMYNIWPVLGLSYAIYYQYNKEYR